jgi:hypothetical protein
MPKNLIGEIIEASPNRRSFLKTLGAATAGVTALSMTGLKSAEAATATEVEVLKFALNLEYLEAEFYTYALYGKGITDYGIGIDGEANGSNPAEGGYTKGGAKVAFNDHFFPTEEIATQIGADERAHVALIRSALGSQKIAKPNINLNALDLDLSAQADFLLQSRIFEDIGLSAYAGAAGLLSTPSIITTAARILGAEAEHVSSVRTQIAYLKITTKQLDGADIIPPPSGTSDHVLSVNISNGLPAVRTPGQVLYLAFGNKADANKGGFFPTGVNGSITTSTSRATSANLS